MKKLFSLNKIFFVILFLFVAANSFPQQKKLKLENEINKVISTDFFKNSQIAIDVYDLTSQRVLYRKNEKLLFRPASTIKLLTTAASILFLDDYRFSTSIYYKGDLRDSILFGNLYVVGGLDPEFSLLDLDTLIFKIRSSGIKEIRGNLLADISAMDSLFWGSGWMWDDDPTPSSPYLSALNINDNCIKINYSPNFLSKPALITTTPETNFVTVSNNSIMTDKKNSALKITRDWINRSNTINVTGELSINEKPGETILNIFDPTNYFLSLLKENLKRNKIGFSGQTKISTLENGAKEIFTYNRTIDSTVINVNKNSDNLSAEMLLRALGLKYSGKPASADKGIKLIDSLITTLGMDPKSYKIADGSGLSFYNLISAELLTGLLKYFHSNGNESFTKLFNSLPVAGIDGTLKDRMKKSPVFQKVNAKTGTISGVSNLSGYLTNKSNHLIAFTIMIQNFTGSSKVAREVQDKICEIIFNN
ncbi:MAG: D-alanyl-D-alanine carboxypeptidase/D-alanyl-D-alanine-endopeptidase [Melioribacter sp.]|nr:D-alanyl-D-alanine carboxypeptidase/D-alanyl-D-alanine-endopeptidase [Melioribacter sp.]